MLRPSISVEPEGYLVSYPQLTLTADALKSLLLPWSYRG